MVIFQFTLNNQRVSLTSGWKRTYQRWDHRSNHFQMTVNILNAQRCMSLEFPQEFGEHVHVISRVTIYPGTHLRAVWIIRTGWLMIGDCTTNQCIGDIREYHNLLGESRIQPIRWQWFWNIWNTAHEMMPRETSCGIHVIRLNYLDDMYTVCMYIFIRPYSL